MFKELLQMTNALFFGKKFPLTVTFLLTYRCNYRCPYCLFWKVKKKELTTKQVFSKIDELKDMGTMNIIYSGGEPLLRKDIGKIIDYTKKRGIFCLLLTNGALIPRKLKDIKNVDIIHLSFDGPETITTRDKNSFQDFLKAIKKIKKYKNINIWVTTVLTKFNIDHTDLFLETAKEYKFKIYFQPVSFFEQYKEFLKPNQTFINYINSILPSKKNFRKTIKRLIELKKTNPYISNSKEGLKYMLNWPIHQKKFKCWAEQLHPIIYTNGRTYYCSSKNNVDCNRCWYWCFTEEFVLFSNKIKLLAQFFLNRNFISV